jgi:hypothetical protein
MRAATSVLKDPIIPSDGAWLDPVFEIELHRVGIAIPTARHIVSQLTKLAASSAAKVRAVERDNSLEGEGEVKVLEHKHTMDVLLKQKKSTQKAKIFKLNPAHEVKLRSLFQRNHDGDTAFDEGLYHRYLYCVLARYHALLGHGFQAALGGRAFEVLLRRLEVRFECFASPLNCRYQNFCSAFPDVDWVYGTLMPLP